MFFHFVSPNVYSYLTLAIFSVLVVVDFMRIHKGGDGATAVELALSIYLDGLNIFLALTQHLLRPPRLAPDPFHPSNVPFETPNTRPDQWTTICTAPGIEVA